jgi:hypothetical protein
MCLYGIDSVMCPLPRRQGAWKRLETGLDRQKLAAMTREIDLSGVPEVAAAILAGQVPRPGRGQNSLNTFRICRRTAWHSPAGLKKPPLFR